VLETRRMLIRRFTEADLPALYELYRHAEIMEYVDGRPRSYEETADYLKRYIAEYVKNDLGLYATILKENGEMIGRCGIITVQGELGLEGELVFMLNRAYWKQGLATEFADAIMQHIKDHFHLKRIFAHVDRRNVASVRVLEKIGMRRVSSKGAEDEYEITFA